MRPRKTNAMFVGLVLLAALTALPAFDSWSMGSRVPTVGMQAEDFRLTDLDGQGTEPQPVSRQDRAPELLGHLVQTLHDRNAGDASQLRQTAR